MPPKRPSHLDDPPAASSSEDEEEASSEEDPSEDEEEDPKLVRKTTTLASPTKKPLPSDSDSDDDSSSGSDEDDDDDDSPPATPVKPISSKAMDDSSAAAAAKKPRSNPTATPAKRPSGGEEDASKASKRSRKKSGAASPANSEGDEKKLSQRLWSEEDEIVILKGMIDFAAKGSSDPASETADFYEFIRDSIHAEDFSKSQLNNKVRQLRKKYFTNVKKDYVPEKSHEKMAYDLSRKIWFGKGEVKPEVNGTLMTPAVRARSIKAEVLFPLPMARTLDDDDDDDMDSKLLYYLGRYDNRLPDDALKKGLDLVPDDKKAEFLDTMEKIEVAEADLYLRRSQAVGEQAKFIVDAFHSR